MITKHEVKTDGDAEYNTVFTEHDGSTDEETTVQYESIEEFYEAKPELKGKIIDSKDSPSSED